MEDNVQARSQHGGRPGEFPHRPLITPAQFIERWNSIADAEPLHPVLPEYIPWMGTRRMSDESRQFMIEAGLPSDAAPFLSLYESSDGLPPLWTVFGREEDWNVERQAPIQRYGMVGSDGGGNPICLDEEQEGCILLLRFYDFEPEQFINSSIPQFAEFLLLYRDAHTAVQATEKEGEGSNLETATQEKQKLAGEFMEIDPDAMIEGTFWYHEVADFDGAWRW